MHFSGKSLRHGEKIRLHERANSDAPGGLAGGIPKIHQARDEHIARSPPYSYIHAQKTRQQAIGLLAGTFDVLES